MSITDELREWFKDRLFMGNGYAELTAIADRIDAEHESACAEAYGSGVESVALPDMSAFCERLREAAERREDVTLWGVDYVALEAKRRKTHTTEYCDRCEGAVLPKWKNCPWCGAPLEVDE